MNNKVDKFVGEIRERVDNFIDEVRTHGGGLIKICLVYIPEDMTTSEKRNAADLICEFLPYNNINCTVQNMYSDAEYGQEIIISIDGETDHWFFNRSRINDYEFDYLNNNSTDSNLIDSPTGEIGSSFNT